MSDLVLGTYYVNSDNGAGYVIFGTGGGFAASFSLNGTNGFIVPGGIKST